MSKGKPLVKRLRWSRGSVLAFRTQGCGFDTGRLGGETNLQSVATTKASGSTMDIGAHGGLQNAAHTTTDGN
jgi:hypothetical protein